MSSLSSWNNGATFFPISLYCSRVKCPFEELRAAKDPLINDLTSVQTSEAWHVVLFLFSSKCLFQRSHRLVAFAVYVFWISVYFLIWISHKVLLIETHHPQMKNQKSCHHCCETGQDLQYCFYRTNPGENFEKIKNWTKI